MPVKFPIVLALIAAVACIAEAQTFRCGSRVVSVGEPQMEVAIKCGEPDAKNSYQEEITEIEKTDADVDPNKGATERQKLLRKNTVTTDEWTYNPGPDEFIRILKFKNGYLVDIREAGYGWAEPRSSKTACDQRSPERGATKAEVQAMCGAPSWKQSRKEEVREDIDEHKSRILTITFEEWTYNFGPDKFLRIFEFRNDRLINIKTGGYGN